MEKKDRFFLCSILIFVTGFLFLDLFVDLIEGASTYHTFVQILVTVSAIVGILWIWRKSLSVAKKLQTKKTKIGFLSEKNKELAYGLSLAVDNQFNIWLLTEVEKEIGYFLLKGFSLKEIANYRQTAEITVRQQCARIYEKAQLAGRIELSAFFMEDFLIQPESLQISNRDENIKENVFI
jgi:DNA-binding CsgD family transcriptional regulator